MSTAGPISNTGAITALPQGAAGWGKPRDAVPLGPVGRGKPQVASLNGPAVGVLIRFVPMMELCAMIYKSSCIWYSISIRDMCIRGHFKRSIVLSLEKAWTLKENQGARDYVRRQRNVSNENKHLTWIYQQWRQVYKILNHCFSPNFR